MASELHVKNNPNKIAPLSSTSERSTRETRHIELNAVEVIDLETGDVAEIQASEKSKTLSKLSRTAQASVKAFKDVAGVAVVQGVANKDLPEDLEYETKNRYRVVMLPGDKAVKKSHDDNDGWVPEMQDLVKLHSEMLLLEEDQTWYRYFCIFMGCAALRPITLHFTVNENGDAFIARREGHLGVAFGDPLTMTVETPAGRRIGRVRENIDNFFKRMYQSWCLCTTYHDLEVASDVNDFTRRYRIRMNFACCGRLNNFSCTYWATEMIFDILDEQDEIVANIQKTTDPSYLISFPPDSTLEERILLITAILQIDYSSFDPQGSKDCFPFLAVGTILAL